MSTAQILAASLAVIVATAAIVARRRKRGLTRERLVISLAAAAALAIYASGLLSGLPDAKKLIEDLAKALGSGTYALVAVMAFLETGAFVGLIAPGEFTVIVGGVIAGQGTIEVIPLLGLVWLSCVVGDSASFFVGRRLGRQFLERHGPRVKITHERLTQVDDYFARHGGKTILIGRFIGIVRAVAPFIAGASGLRYRSFLPYSVIGTGLWGTFYTLLGYLFYRSFDKVAATAGTATFVFAALVLSVVAIVAAYRRLRVPENRERLTSWIDRQGRRPLLRPLAALVRPAWRRAITPAYTLIAPRARFLWHRLTPGDLGLELTTAIAIAGVGLYVFVAYTVAIEADHGATLLDDRVLDLADTLNTGFGVSLAKVVTAFGSLPVTAAAAVAGAIVLAARRRPIELAVLLLSAIAIYAAVHITKSAVDRPRPPRPLVHASLSAFPSGHAAYSTIYVALALIATRLKIGVGSRAALVVGALLVAGAIGASRAYLRVHWWSDVLAGWALGAAIFGSLAAAGVVVGYFRNNDGGHPAAAGAGGTAGEQ
jgi:undecaprenyl-diphosphatase